MSKFLLLTFFSLLFSNPNLSEPIEPVAHPAFPYNLSQPNALFEMPESLKEISGLDLVEDELFAINDEEGFVFAIDKRTGKVVKQINFWNEGDYEGIEIVGNDAFVVKSSGTIYHVQNFLTDSLRTEKLKSFLNKENDIEGVAYDPDRKSLLIGCKGKIAEGEDEQAVFKKAIYEFNLDDMVMKSTPAYLLTLPDIQEYIEHMKGHGISEKLLEYFSEKAEDLKFSPSGIAIHPITKNVYVTSSKGKMLLVLDPNGKILHLQKLKKKMHAQPEGICFDEDGTLYIANEGKDSKAIIYKFLYKN